VFRSGQSQCVPLFRSVDYHILVKKYPERDVVVPFRRSVPEIIPTQQHGLPARVFIVAKALSQVSQELAGVLGCTMHEIL